MCANKCKLSVHKLKKEDGLVSRNFVAVLVFFVSLGNSMFLTNVATAVRKVPSEQ